MTDPKMLAEIDLAALTLRLIDAEYDESTFHRIADQVNAAFQQQGFLVLRNHGIPLDLIHRLRASAEGFFLRTGSDEKGKCAYRAPVPRGYSGNRKENFAILAGNKLPNDLVEKYRMGPWRVDSSDPYFSANKDAQMMFYPNKWPENDVYGLQRAMETYYEAMESLATLLLKIFERCLSLPEGFFHDKLDRHTSILSVNHYPPVDKQVQKGQLRLAEHTDVDLFTILCPDWADEVGCLQVKDAASDVWSSVTLVPETLIVNIGDGFNYWTAGQWLSTCHRVIVPQGREGRSKSRFAIAYFVGANYDAPLSRLPVCDPDASYEEKTYVEWRKLRVQEALEKLPRK
ncbi:hypothetical protein Poli38472_008965 [Pythium oligandrum]|uniref:Fe2OG dioxygenase domain-containing protein n=1 Tax=Pythium oligandrum TaxID=41045 RepID=A0A8K1FNN2_PYTOL|nr:hypothetical protein Poli38472_008965 [Pythium oligandrum]|eukprot:TMW64798.1 hypothetical protein Poli38472_008965 [Pythium oligandrum]